MVTSFHAELAQVQAYFSQGDTHLGYRRLLDAAIESGNFDVYEATLQFCDWYEGHKDDAPALSQRLQDLLQIIENGYRPIATPLPGPVLEASALTKTYASGRFHLAPIDLSLHLSQIIGLVGENGNGKTTLLRLLYGELAPDSGEISYPAAPPQGDFYDLRTRMAFIPQRPVPWYGSLMDNMQYYSAYLGLKGRENRLWTEILLARMGLRAFRSFHWNRISSGYKMRFELARTLLGRPQILLLDEPLANLDVLAQQVILEDLKFMARSQRHPMAIMLSSQQLYEVEKVSNEVIFLREGKAQRGERSTVGPAAGGLVLELETEASRETLQADLADLPLRRLSFNGGVYLAYFDAPATVQDVLRALADARLPLQYLRDISHSSRRFFDA